MTESLAIEDETRRQLAYTGRGKEVVEDGFAFRGVVRRISLGWWAGGLWSVVLLRKWCSRTGGRASLVQGWSKFRFNVPTY